MSNATRPSTPAAVRSPPAIVDPEVIDAIKDGRIEIVQGIEALGPRQARLADGATVAPDAIVCATGYRRGCA